MKALITGVSGQDGSYLAEFLLSKGYEVHGLVRKLPSNTNMFKFFRIKHILHHLKLYEGDVEDLDAVRELIKNIQPEEIYDLAAIVDPLVSFKTESKILQNNLFGVHNFLGSIKEFCPEAKYFFASSSMIFGDPVESPQDEMTPKNPITPYGIAKSAGGDLVRMYRDVYGIYTCSGILYNHESPRRDLKFLPRKVTHAVARIKAGLQNELVLGDISSIRDWGYAGDFVEVMWLMLQQDKPQDFVIGTGNIHTVRDLLELAFRKVDLNWEDYVKTDNSFVRKKESKPLIANPSKARKELGWVPKHTFKELVHMMVEADQKSLRERDVEFKN